MKVAILGPKGTYTHQAADQYFGKELEPVFYSTIRDVIDAQEQTKIVPIENTLGGGVEETVEQLRQNKNLKVVAEQRIPINHCLISDQKKKEIQKVKSHPQALSQCKKYIKEHEWEEEETNSTADAVENLNEGEAAIASKIAAKLKNKDIIEQGIQDKERNQTRFFILKETKQKEEKISKPQKEEASLILEPETDRPGLLHEILGCFAKREINLTHIQSRPTKNKLGEYYFYLECQLPDNENKFEEALQELEKLTKTQLLGKYPVKSQKIS